MRNQVRSPRRLAVAGAVLVLALVPTACIVDGSWQSNTVARSHPLGRLDPRLDSVSCISVTFCLTVGSDEDPATGIADALIFRWDGDDVTQLDAGLPAELGAVATDVACAGVDDCLVVVRASAAPTPHHLLYRFDGTSFDAVPWSAGFDGELVIDCLPAPNPSCLAVDEHNTYLWDPFEVEITDIGDTGTTGTLDLSCIAVDGCFATDGTSTVWSWAWSGSTRVWSPVPLVHPEGGSVAALAVDCYATNTATCVIVGSRTPSAASASEPVAFRTSMATSATTSIDLPASLGAGAVTSVSCTADAPAPFAPALPYSCVALGSSTTGVPFAVAGLPENDQFLPATAPPPGPGIVYPSLSCPFDTTGCLAVARFDDTDGTSAIVASYHWD